MFVITPTVATAMAQKLTGKLLERNRQECKDFKANIQKDESYLRMVKLREDAEKMRKEANQIQSVLEETYTGNPMEVKVVGDSELLVTKRQHIFGIKNEIILKNQVEGKNMEQIEKEILDLYK